MAAQTDFWGEIVPAEERTPLAILREQAALLGTKTKNLVEATVDTSVNPLARNEFIHRFALVVPSLGNYKYELFRIEHGVAIYPIHTSEPPPALGLETEQEFVDWLRRKLSSVETKRIIANLLAQAMS
jgi:hypothetical protein